MGCGADGGDDPEDHGRQPGAALDVGEAAQAGYPDDQDETGRELAEYREADKAEFVRHG